MSSNFDALAFVEAEKDKANLAFTDDKQMARFELGVSMLVYKWEALDLAVQNGWGGPESAEKRDWVTAIIVDLFKTGRVVDVALIEETLLYAMMDEFETNVDDDSALPIAAQILEIYKQCDAQNFSNVEMLYEEWTEKQKSKQADREVQIGGDPWNPDVSDNENDDEDDEDESDQDHARLVQDDDGDVNMDDEKVEPVVDEDGFELVQKKNRRARN
ncbi:LANO_0G12882g1_1 [Lachancea nothofagi CBS 11611]|uniref:LANO_0G12882g1_1 n=1 Tax=Lachancea nothofagi CBS 11611 TaxID=1266666 RepID=A0A1G4KJX3_9SACH|nr:LANO_0G12882g1_1 [Lachancea nothofagi CBS 11611]